MGLYVPGFGGVALALPVIDIFCREFHAELVAVAGHYKVLEDIPKELRGKAVQIWLEDEQIRIAALD